MKLLQVLSQFLRWKEKMRFPQCLQPPSYGTHVTDLSTKTQHILKSFFQILGFYRGALLYYERVCNLLWESRGESSRWAMHHEDHRQNSFSPHQPDSAPSASPTFIDKHMPDVRRVHTLGTNTKQFSPHLLASAPWAPPASWMREAKGSPLWSTTLTRRR